MNELEKISEKTCSSVFLLWFEISIIRFDKYWIESWVKKRSNIIVLSESSEIKVGEETRGGIVQAKMEFMPQNIYDYKGVLVSGSHWVVEDNQFIEVEDSKHGILTDRIEPVYTFKTSNNRIWIYDIEFGDFETGSDDDWAPYFEKVKQDLNKKLRGEA